MLFTKGSRASKGSPRWRPVTRALLAGCAAGSISLSAQAFGGGAAGAASSSVVLHYFQKQAALTFYNASGVVIQGYPPVGGHVKEDDLDYVGDHSHHAKAWTVSDHLFCTVVTAPAMADCFMEFAVGGSLIYTDNLTANLAGNVPTTPVDGGTGKFAGFTGTVTTTAIGNSNNSDLVVTLHKG
jgi:hypothetical protein